MHPTDRTFGSSVTTRQALAAAIAFNRIDHHRLVAADVNADTTAQHPLGHAKGRRLRVQPGQFGVEHRVAAAIFVAQVR